LSQYSRAGRGEFFASHSTSFSRVSKPYSTSLFAANGSRATIGSMNGSQAASCPRKRSRHVSSRIVPNCVYQPPRNRLTVLSVGSNASWTWKGVHGLRSSFSANAAL
jgi:hypothetical protein